MSEKEQSRAFPNGHHSHHKKSRSREDSELGGFPGRPATSAGVHYNDGPGGYRLLGDSANSSGGLQSRATSPLPSGNLRMPKDQGHHHNYSSPGLHQGKRSFLRVFRRGQDHLKNLPNSTKSALDPSKSSRSLRRELSPSDRLRQGSEASNAPSFRDNVGDSEHRKGGGGHGKFLGRKAFTTDASQSPEEGQQQQQRNGVFELDTDLAHMEGIVDRDRGSDASLVPTGEDGTRQTDEPSTSQWAPPESWQVKKNDIATQPTEKEEEASNKAPEKEGTQYFIRVFRIDSTFATLSAGLNATVADILRMLGKKSFLQDHLNNYEIVLRKHDLSRQLARTERPIRMQKKMLEQVGYTSMDKIEDIGREDHSYLCRFIFMPAKLSGYASLEGDPGFNRMQRFSHVDLQGRSLATIPITLYKKSSEIISLNLSRNLSLDVPKDFIQSCINLREIKFMGNEAYHVPASFSLASRLTYLDISNNFLEQLDDAHLDRLQGLVSIKMANNRLKQLPSYFGDFQSLRSLNMSSNSFQVFPAFLCNLKNLVDLDISFNSIEALPNIGRITSLERLWATNNVLSGSLCDSFKDLVKLKEIDARFNSIKSMDVLTQLPCLEQLLLGHNAISKFSGAFPKLRTLLLDHCPMTEFDIAYPMPSLTSLNIASAKLVQFSDTMFEYLPNLTKLILDRNHLSSLSSHIGKLRNLEHFSIIKNPLASIPATIGCLTELRFLNLRECNLNRLPGEVWYCSKLETLNVSSNVLDAFPRHGYPPPQLPSELSWTPNENEDRGPLDELRRPSQVSAAGSSPKATSSRKTSATSATMRNSNRKVSTVSRMEGALYSRKESNFSQHMQSTFAGSLRHLYLADNRLDDDAFRELSLLPELRVVNLSYNELSELPSGILKRWSHLSELYLSGNELIALPSDDLEEGSSLKFLYINRNRFQTLPAELCKVSTLSALDVGSNALKYNVSNWPYDWNWNWNRNLRYLNFSGNKRLEIKPNIATLGGAGLSHGADLTDFNSLTHLRVLGLMDVTLTKPTIPEESDDRRVRTSATLTGPIFYGMADSLGKTEHLSIIDMIVPRVKQDNVEMVVGMFDGKTQSSGGSRISKFLHENFTPTFSGELRRLQESRGETPLDALRRAFLALNKNMATSAYKSIDYRELNRGPATANLLNVDDIHNGGVATVLYLKNMDLYVANVGDAEAFLVKADGSSTRLTQKHDPAETHERARIRNAGGFVSRNGKLNDVLPVSRAFGYFQLMPAVIAAPYTTQVTLTEQDEMIIIASKEVWDYVTPDVVVDAARAEGDSMLAAQKIRDLAIAFGATNKLMVMIMGVSELRKRERLRLRPHSVSMGPQEAQIIPTVKRPKKQRDGPGDSRLARLDFVEAPVGELAIVFTDIKKSTALWETCPHAMRSANQIHNDILRRQIGIIGGYEVKTEGDAFMVAFATTTSALLWCFNCQTQLLEAEWPTEILEQPQCRVQYDMDNQLIFRGLSVRMGVHWGEPVCEKDPVTNRMDYFGPMVNRTSRISAVADGGQIFVSSDFMSDFQRNQEIFADGGKAVTAGLGDGAVSDLAHNIRRELQQLNSQGFVIKDQGELKLKGLENPEPLYLVYPHSLSGRLSVLDNSGESGTSTPTPTTISKHSQLEIPTDIIWRLWEFTLRIERLCGAFETNGERRPEESNMELFDMVKNHGGELGDPAVIGLVEQQVTRIEVSCPSLLFVESHG